MREELELVKELISVVEENGLAELNIDFKGMKVEIKKESQEKGVSYMPPFPFPQAPGMSIGNNAAASSVAEEEQEVSAPIASGIPIKSPLAGVFYRAPKPTAPPFINVGDIAERGQTLCIIEAMKLMNEISAESRGKITKICKENAEIVAEGDVLFYLEPEE